jgi:two-component system, NarL family, nitrate/nitrite sensor histidine kinase NarQ
LSYKGIKWLILILPTVAIGLWEYSRHAFLLPYISMETGNILSPLFVFMITIIFLRKLFTILERMHEELKTEKAKKAALLERENLARELHDGIAQSLFLLSVKVNKFGRHHGLQENEDFQKIKQTLQHVHDDTRQAITNLKYAPTHTPFSWKERIHQYKEELENQHFMRVHLQWKIKEDTLSSKEKVELFACIKEAVTNVMKHAKTNEIWILAKETENGWFCYVKDKGTGFTLPIHEGYGLQIMKNRARDMNWGFSVRRENDETIVELKKEA